MSSISKTTGNKTPILWVEQIDNSDIGESITANYMGQLHSRLTQIIDGGELLHFSQFDWVSP